MSTQSKTMPSIELKVYIRVVAAVFILLICLHALLGLGQADFFLIKLYWSKYAYKILNYLERKISSTTAFIFALLRLLNEELFYVNPLVGSELGIHYVISGLMLVASVIGFLNSTVVINRGSAMNVGRNITTWLLLDSLFETSRVIYVFICEIVLKGQGPIQPYELLISAAQYLLDSFLYCQMILRH